MQGFVDFDGAENIKNSAMEIQKSLDLGNFLGATYGFFFLQYEVAKAVEFIDFYDVLNKQRMFSFQKLYENVEGLMKNLENETFYHAIMMEMNNVKPESAASINSVMDRVHEALQLPQHVQWNGFDVFSPLLDDFMKPVDSIVEKLLNETDVQVVVFSGNSDLICATPGTMTWLNRLNWHGKEDFANTTRRAFSVNNTLEGYQRRFDNLNMYWVS